MTAAFGAALGGAIVALRASGRELPERISVGDLVLAGVATHKVSRLIANDKVTSFLRRAVHPLPGARRPRRTRGGAARDRRPLRDRRAPRLPVLPRAMGRRRLRGRPRRRTAPDPARRRHLRRRDAVRLPPARLQGRRRPHVVAPIRDHALLSDCRTAALVTRAGAVDWWPSPRFDASSAFSALLDDDAGHWTLRPAGPFATRAPLPARHARAGDDDARRVRHAASDRRARVRAGRARPRDRAQRAARARARRRGAGRRRGRRARMRAAARSTGSRSRA